MDKKTLREGFLVKRKKNILSDEIKEKIFRQGLGFLPQKGTVAFYYPIKEEMSLELLWEEAWKMGLRVVFPKVISGDRMIFCEVFSLNDLQEGNFGIKEPISNKSWEIIDLAFIPGCGFGEDGSRLGYGKGYYDRYFQDYETILVGVSWDNCVCDSIPQEKHDVPCVAIITEEKMIKCKKVW